MSRDTKKMIPCDCPKGGIYTTAEGGERVCDRCDGFEYVEDNQMTKDWAEYVKEVTRMTAKILDRYFREGREEILEDD